MNTALQTIDMTLPVGSLDAYLQQLYRMPMLSADKEYELAMQFRETGDIEAARQLVLAHMRFVAKIAKNYLGYGLALSDLIQEGTIGLMKAVKKFDPDMGVRLVSFAVHWIKAEIHEFIIKNWRIVKIATTKAQRKLFFKLRSSKTRLGWFTKDEVEDVARTLNVNPATVLEMEKRLNANDAAFDAQDDEDFSAPVNILPDLSANPEKIAESADFQTDNRERLAVAFQKLDDRSQMIITKRWLDEEKATLKELANQFSVSIERVRQLEQQAMNKLRALMEAS